jgi:HEAT repeat protein
MTELLGACARLAPIIVWAALATAVTMAAAVVIERAEFGVRQALDRRLLQRYRTLVQRALAGDETARGELLDSPARHRLALARLLMEPLITDRDAERIATTRAIAAALGVFRLADRYLQSWFWWRRALALRALGLAQARDHTAQLVAALDDSHPDVRAAALDGLSDMRDPAALKAIVVRLHDTSLHRGRRGAVLKAFGSDCEPFLLEWSAVDAENRLDYIHALAICGTARSRPVLCGWTRDTRLEVRATAFEALAYVGLDDESARVAIEGLESDDPPVRAMAAHALRGWQGPGNAATCLARHLDDTWAVAVRAARTLQSMGPAGSAELQARASRSDIGGLLARQMLWQPGARR